MRNRCCVWYLSEQTGLAGPRRLPGVTPGFSGLLPGEPRGSAACYMVNPGVHYFAAGPVTGSSSLRWPADGGGEPWQSWHVPLSGNRIRLAPAAVPRRGSWLSCRTRATALVPRPSTRCRVIRRAQKSRRQVTTGVGAPRRRPTYETSSPAWLFAPYSGPGSDSRLLSSWMSTATLASASACLRPWCAQKSSSPPLASRTRTYAWAPQRSQTSKAVSGLVGAIAPVTVASLALTRVLRLTAQCNTYPGPGVPYSEWCTPQAKPRPDASCSLVRR